MSQHTSSQIGDLLSGAGLVSPESIDGALTMSRTKKQPLGKILVDSGLVSEVELSGSLQAQNLIRERLLKQEEAISILSEIRANGKSFLDNLLSSDCQVEPINFAMTLGRLFIDASALIPQQLNDAMETCIISGLPLVRVLVLQKCMDEKSAYAGLTAQLLVNEKKVARDQAVGALKLAHMHGDHVEEILEFGGFKRYRAENIVRLGELLVLSDLISEIDLLGCVERSMSEAKPLGQVLVDEGIMDEQLVNSALRAQKYIEDGTVDAIRASQMLKYCARTGQLLEFSLEEIASIKPQKLANGGNPETIGQLLYTLGLISLKNMEQVELVQNQEPERVEEFILNRHILTADTLEAVKAGQSLMKEGRIEIERLIFAIHVWLWSRGDFNKLVKIFGW